MFNFHRFLSVLLVLLGCLQGLAYKVGTGKFIIHVVFPFNVWFVTKFDNLFLDHLRYL